MCVFSITVTPSQSFCYLILPKFRTTQSKARTELRQKRMKNHTNLIKFHSRREEKIAEMRWNKARETKQTHQKNQLKIQKRGLAMELDHICND